MLEEDRLLEWVVEPGRKVLVVLGRATEGEGIGALRLLAWKVRVVEPGRKVLVVLGRATEGIRPRLLEWIGGWEELGWEVEGVGVWVLVLERFGGIRGLVEWWEALPETGRLEVG